MARSVKVVLDVDLGDLEWSLQVECAWNGEYAVFQCAWNEAPAYPEYEQYSGAYQAADSYGEALEPILEELKERGRGLLPINVIDSDFWCALSCAKVAHRQLMGEL